MRTFIAIASLTCSLSAFAATPVSVNFQLNPTYLNQFGKVYIYATGLTGPLNVAYSYEFGALQAPVTGTIQLTPQNTLAGYTVTIPETPVYLRSVQGTTTITYQAPGDGQPTSKTENVIVTQPLIPTSMETVRRYAETDSSVHSVTLRLAKPAAMPIIVYVRGGDYWTAKNNYDYSIIDQYVIFPAGQTVMDARFRILSDNVIEGMEQFALSCDGPDINGSSKTVQIVDHEINTNFDPPSQTVFAGDPFVPTLFLESLYLEFEKTQAHVSISPSTVAAAAEPIFTLGSGDSFRRMQMTADRPGDATITVGFDDWLLAKPATTTVHVFDSTFDLYGVTSVDVAVGATVGVPIRMIPAPPQKLTVNVEEQKPGAFVTLDPNLMFDTNGTRELAITGRAEGKTTVLVKSAGQRKLATLAVNVVSPLDVKSIAPAAGHEGTPVTISGTAFHAPCQVKFGNVAGVMIAQPQDVKLVAQAPAHAAGVVDVTVTCNGATRTLPKAFTYLPSRTRSVRH